MRRTAREGFVFRSDETQPVPPNLPPRALTAFHPLHFHVTTSFNNHPVTGSSALSELRLFKPGALEKTDLYFALFADIRFFESSACHNTLIRWPNSVSHFRSKRSNHKIIFKPVNKEAYSANQ